MTDLRITSVGYSRLANLGGYENEKVNASARVDEGQDAAEVLESLKAWVNERVSSENEAYGLRESAHDLRWKIEGLNRQLADAKQKWEAAKALLHAHGVKVEEPEDLPF